MTQLLTEISDVQRHIHRGQERLVLRPTHLCESDHFFAGALEAFGVYGHLSIFVRGALVKQFLATADNMEKPLLNDPLIINLETKSVELVRRNELQIEA